MKQLNKVELRGVLGVLRVISVGDTRYATMSVATDYCYKNAEGWSAYTSRIRPMSEFVE